MLDVFGIEISNENNIEDTEKSKSEMCFIYRNKIIK